MQQKIENASHPLSEYAEFAHNTIRNRFPLGAGDNIDNAKLQAKALQDNLIKFIRFSSLTPHAQEYTHILTDLNCGNADILACYALGSLRLRYPKMRSLFNLMYINQTIPGIINTQTHVLLVIGAQENISSETLFTHNPNALICDLWSEETYLIRDFEQRKTLTTPNLMGFLLYHLPTTAIAGLSFHPVKNLHGEISIFPIKMQAASHQILEETVHADITRSLRKSYATESLDEAKRFPGRSIFAVPAAQKREVWEKDHPNIIGYVTDQNGICHKIHRLTGTIKQYAFWNELTNAAAPITFKKSGEQFVSSMGPLSTVQPCSSSTEHKTIQYR